MTVIPCFVIIINDSSVEALAMYCCLWICACKCCNTDSLLSAFAFTGTLFSVRGSLMPVFFQNKFVEREYTSGCAFFGGKAAYEFPKTIQCDCII